MMRPPLEGSVAAGRILETPPVGVKEFHFKKASNNKHISEFLFNALKAYA
jgi:hypothetical protein